MMTTTNLTTSVQENFTTTAPTIRDDTSPDDATAMASSGNEATVDFEALNVEMTMSLLPTIVYIVVLMVVGLVGNTVVLVVYYRRFKPSASRTYILAMSVCDLLANVLSLPSEVLDIRYTFTFDIPSLCRAVRSVNSFLALSSAFILVAVARDRYNKICHPLAKPRSQARIKVYILICCLASLALSVVFAVLNGSHSIPSGVGNVNGTTCSVDDAYRGTLLPLAYNLIMAVAFISCVVIMGVSYTAIALKLWRHKKKNLAQAASRGGPGRGNLDSSAVSSQTVPADKHGVIAEDNSSGARSDSVGSGKPLERGSSETRIKLLAVRNLQYQGPRSSEEDSDEGCFSGGDTSTSVDVSNDVHPHAESTAHPDPQTRSLNLQTNAGKDSDKAGQKTLAVREQDLGSQDNETSLSRDSSLRGIHSQGSVTKKPVVSPEHRKPTSLLHRVFRAGKGQPQGPSTSCKTPKRHGNVKAIPSSTTLMMFVLTATFVVNYLPHLIIISARAVSDDFGKGLTGAVLNVYNVGLRSYFMNCAVNSLVYGFCSARFRQECRQLFRGGR